jgi:hypothetical protein
MNVIIHVCFALLAITTHHHISYPQHMIIVPKKRKIQHSHHMFLVCSQWFSITFPSGSSNSQCVPQEVPNNITLFSSHNSSNPKKFELSFVYFGECPIITIIMFQKFFFFCDGWNHENSNISPCKNVIFKKSS